MSSRSHAQDVKNDRSSEALERNLRKAGQHPPSQHTPEEKQLDKALTDSFPASDPPSQTDPHVSVVKVKDHEASPVRERA